jgi:phosphoribosylglycinamide formyltransferase-1
MAQRPIDASLSDRRLTRPPNPLRVAVLISGGGRTLLNIADRIDDGTLPAEIVLVISSRSEAPGVEKARARGLNVKIASRKDFPTAEAMDEAIAAWLREARAELVLLAGYLRLLHIPPDFAGRVMNIHPALLPAHGGKSMHGDAVHRAVLASGAKITGCTVHFVDEHYDHGPIILQREVAVLPDDDEHTLAGRVFEQELIAYPEAIRLFAEKRLELAGDRVRIKPATKC